MTLHLKVITPEQVLFSDTVESVCIPTTSGAITVLPGHIPLISELERGELHILSKGKDSYLSVEKGLVRLSADTLCVLTEAALQAQTPRSSSLTEL